MKDKITIIGAGPAGLFCALQLLERGYAVDLYDQMAGVGKKFLIAGNGGLNLTHSEPLDLFAKKYGKNKELFTSLLKEFSPQDLRVWCKELGVETFVGTSGRVFPEKLKAAEILSNWKKKLNSFDQFELFLDHRLVNIATDKLLTFDHTSQQVEVRSARTIFALGGASWKQTGSNGKWKELFENVGISVTSFLPMNCGFERPWSSYFLDKTNHTPLKNVSLTIDEHHVRGEMMLTPFGIEGGVVYAVSNIIRDKILSCGSASIAIDLKPDLPFDKILVKLKARKQKVSLSNFLRKVIHLDKYAISLLRELSDPKQFDQVDYLAMQIKSLKIELFAARPLAEAISTSGGVAFEGLSEDLESINIPGFYIVGEMLDFDAPTGGYLLQGCFSTAWRVVTAIDR